MDDFLSFRRMITPIIIQIVFWLGVVVAILVGLIQLTHGNTALGIALIILGPIAVRIYCELLILFFVMNETLTEISHQLGQSRWNGGPRSAMGSRARYKLPFQSVTSSHDSSTGTQMDPQPGYDTCEIKAEVIKAGSHARTTIRFVAVAEGREGEYVAGTSPTFRYYGEVGPEEDFVPAYARAFDGNLQTLVDQLAREGWEPLPPGGQWYSRRFQRAADETDPSPSG